MRKYSRILLMVTLLVLALSFAALADDAGVGNVEDPNAEFKFGDKNGQWGFVYLLPFVPDESGEFKFDEGTLTPYYKINAAEWKGPFNKKVTGAYVTGGQSVDTILGIHLPVKYSPYIAQFHDQNRILGVKVGQFVYEFGPVRIGLDGTYAFTHVLANADKVVGKPSQIFGPRRNDILLDIDASYADILDVDIAVNRYSVPKDKAEAKAEYDYYYNFAVEAALKNVVPGLNVSGVYAYYQPQKAEDDNEQKADYLYEITATYDVLPEVLTLRAGHRNSEFEDGFEKPSVVGGPDAGNEKTRYIADLRPIETIYKRDKSFNVGATYKFVYDVIDAKLDVDYDTTNRNQRGDLDDNVVVKLDTKALGYNLYQEFSVLIPDKNTTDRGNMINEVTKNRLDYALDFATPEYELPVSFADKVFARARVNFDWDQNYTDKNRYQTIASVELGAQADIWRLDDLYVGGIFAYDMPSDEDVIKDAFKFALIGKYDAPNGIKFRVEYQSSADYANDKKFVHGKPLNDRYDQIRYYDNSKFHGVRVSVGFPL